MSNHAGPELGQQPQRSAATANEITAQILLRVPREFQARVWRRNVGAGIPQSIVHQVMSALQRGRYKDALHLLGSRIVRFGHPGESDIDGILGPDGRRLAIEVKAGRDQLNEEQESFGAMVRAHGGVFIVARDVDQAIEDLRLAGAVPTGARPTGAQPR